MIALAAPLIRTSGRVLSASLDTPPYYLQILQVSTASASFVASTIIVFTISCCGSIGLSTPYRRIIFGLSVADIFQSLALLAGPSSVSPGLSGDAGTEVNSCKLNGFMLTLGGLTVMMYTLFICLYYLCKLKYKMSDDAFRHRIEKKFHAFIVVFSLGLNIGALVMDTFHTNATSLSMCTIGPTPTGCETVGNCDPTIKKHAKIFGGIILLASPVMGFVGIIVTMGLLYQHAYVVNQTIEREARVPTTLRNHEESVESQSLAGKEMSTEQTETPQDRVQHLSRLYRREITIQATSYVLAFCFTYIPVVVGLRLSASNINSPTLDTIVMLTYPLGGFLNILVYTRPKVASLRRSHPGCSRLRGFWLVLRAGGEIPGEVDLSVSCCQDCCHVPAWLESEYESRSYGTSQVSRRPPDERPSDAPTSMHLSRIGF